MAQRQHAHGAQGLAYKEIADKLGVSRYTIMTIVQRIYQKLHVHSRGEAVAKHFGLPMS